MHAMACRKTGICDEDDDDPPSRGRRGDEMRLRRGTPDARAARGDRDDGPSDEDLERFGGETALCPRCGAEVWDEAPQCPECGEWIGGATTRHSPTQSWWSQRWIVVMIVVLIVAVAGLLPLILR